ncbi:MAG: hypothetical protein ABSA41_09530, partial [Terriglobia bacterium]
GAAVHRLQPEEALESLEEGARRRNRSLPISAARHPDSTRPTRTRTPLRPNSSPPPLLRLSSETASLGEGW